MHDLFTKYRPATYKLLNNMIGLFVLWCHYCRSERQTEVRLKALEVINTFINNHRLLHEVGSKVPSLKLYVQYCEGNFLKQYSVTL